VRDVEDEWLIAAWRDKHGFGSGVSGSLGFRPGDVAEARYNITLKKCRSESKLGIANMVISQNSSLFLGSEKGKST
jgi:hypothetical protein